MRSVVLSCVLAAVLGAACGGGAKPATIGSGASAEAANGPEAVLRALADAARRDDGKALDALVHPEYGLVLWHQPGAWVSPALTLRAGSGEAPSERLAETGMNDYWLEHYWPHVVEGIDHGLARLDREPADRLATIYGDCAVDDNGGPDPRAWLVASDSFGEALRSSLEDAELQLAPAVEEGLVHFRRWGLEVWLARADGRLWVAHIMVSTPCDA